MHPKRTVQPVARPDPLTAWRNGIMVNACIAADERIHNNGPNSYVLTASTYRWWLQVDHTARRRQRGAGEEILASGGY